MKNIFISINALFIFLNILSCQPENLAQIKDRGKIFDRSRKILVENHFDSERTYLHDNFASHIIGYLQKRPDGNFYAQTGIEYTYNDILNATATRPGYDIVTSIDFDLQKAAEEIFEGQLGSIIVLEAGTGFILASASFPNYNLNEMFNNSVEINKNILTLSPNRAMELTFAPASTLKPFVAFSGFAHNLLSTKTNFTCNQVYNVGSLRWGCLHNHGNLNIAEALKKSCNIPFFDLAQELGTKELGNTLKSFGFGERTGFEIGDEKAGFIPDEEFHIKKYGYDKPHMAINIAIGQEKVQVTALQLALAYDAIINEGELYKPQIVRRVISNEGKIIEERKPIINKQILDSENYLGQIKEFLSAITEPGGINDNLLSDSDFPVISEWLKNSKIVIGGKTGSYKTQGRFIGFAPANAPEIIIAVITSKWGAAKDTAAPIAARVMKAWFDKAI
ncbi:MAG: penicillin-binding transpeptidase domain-containing protein [bacterium]|nr:penicillin-binding transpeptidase domain-containing protein [bacterium]